MKSTSWDKKRADQLRAEGKTAREIAALVGVSTSAINSYFSRTQQKNSAGSRDNAEMSALELLQLLTDITGAYSDVTVMLEGRAIHCADLSVHFSAGNRTAQIVLK